MARLLGLIRGAVFAAIVAIAPTEIEAWRFDLRPPPALQLIVGEPVQWLRPRD